MPTFTEGPPLRGHTMLDIAIKFQSSATLGAGCYETTLPSFWVRFISSFAIAIKNKLVYGRRVALDSLQLTREIALTALAEELYSYWPPSSPEELLSRVEGRLLDRLYGNRDFAEECREEE